MSLVNLIPDTVVNVLVDSAFGSALGLTKENAGTVAIALFVVVTLIVAFLIPKLLSSGSGGLIGGKVGKKLLILGHGGSGKTKLFYRLRAGTFPDTVTSIEPLEVSFPIHGLDLKKEITVIDFPGNARARGSLGSVLKNARGIIFVVDSANMQRETIREVADFLYDVFTGCIREGCEPRVLIVCNKSDLKDKTSSIKEVKRLLEKDLNELKSSRHSLEVEGEESGDIILGTEDQDFDIESDAGCQVRLIIAFISLTLSVQLSRTVILKRYFANFLG
eukprot:CAMPEP_0204821920 /NCGR_PEP_ID=MMETSP1346-20131115/122_1 /ASSEMBLY_ACC=CAM_ASM_000771 /TAXON_ID=215587 /ORGANISM="Aplanochytrium stocchinoi, Strain GSBS06" /LENGTH=275 /DNA_ID=CAMNT_0051947885 /DNA_START=96 /DNA_END=923 /DNA_ORIENTATION=-